MRLFVAIDLDAAARTAVAAEQHRLMMALDTSSMRWVRPEHMHVTLAFMGEVPDAGGAAIVDLMRADLEAPAFTVAFAGLRVFPPHGVPKVLWLGLGSGMIEVAALQGRVADRLRAIGVALDRRAYHPHLTLARWRGATRADRRRAEAADRGEEIARVVVAAVTLYQSHLSSEGPRYTALARTHLQEPTTID